MKLLLIVAAAVVALYFLMMGPDTADMEQVQTEIKEQTQQYENYEEEAKSRNEAAVEALKETKREMGKAGAARNKLLDEQLQ